MDLVVDANVVFSLLIKEGFNYFLLFSGRFHLFTPEYILTEFEKHKAEILKKTERTTEDFFRLLDILERKITIVPLEELAEYVPEAEKISPDPGDMVYFALALKLGCPIWSNDKRLKQQKRVTVYHTPELAKLWG